LRFADLEADSLPCPLKIPCGAQVHIPTSDHIQFQSALVIAVSFAAESYMLCPVIHAAHRGIRIDDQMINGLAVRVDNMNV
jgi:hypothetical protein